jgi:hypothetical protein
VQRLWIKLFAEGDYLICPDRDSAKPVDIPLNIILEVPIGNRTQKWHWGIHRLTQGCLALSLSALVKRI